MVRAIVVPAADQHHKSNFHYGFQVRAIQEHAIFVICQEVKKRVERTCLEQTTIHFDELSQLLEVVREHRVELGSSPHFACR